MIKEGPNFQEKVYTISLDFVVQINGECMYDDQLFLTMPGIKLL